ncbi:MAG: hypothetical protein A2V88_05280 [Elusimicrobia bacterium RBG_16_66_12]|nr:MAG: hypothetical protein A2V88_05280 [Elusimicrobia bacterium RBG_16_66_12]
MSPVSPRAAALALLFCGQASAQTRTGQVAPIPSSGGERVGSAPAVTLAPATVLAPALSQGPTLAAPTAVAAAPPAPVPRKLSAKGDVPDGSRPADLSPVALRERLSVDGRVDPGRVQEAYDGGGLLRGLPKALAEDRALSEHARDGAPRKALLRLSHLGKNHPALQDGAGKAAVGLLRSRLESARPSPPVSALDSALAAAERFLARREFGLALEAGRRAVEGLKAAPLGGLTRLELSRDAYALISLVKDRGGPYLYGRMGEFEASELAERVRGLRRRDPGAYVGEPLSGEPVRVQCYGDCAVQQAYNHPRLSALAGQLPYGSFLAAVEAANDAKVRKEGLSADESRLLLFKLGLDVVRRPAPADAEALVSLLREHGALMMAVSWHAPKALKGGDHAVLVQGALREAGQWRFVLIDSNHSRPQLYSFRDLQLLSPGEFSSVSPLPLDSPYLPKTLRAIFDPGLRLRAGAHAFIERFAVLRPRVPGWKRAAFGAINALRARLGREALEPEPVLERDSNVLPVDKLPARARGLRLPPEALLTGPDGKRYVNRLILERLLNERR